VYSWQLSCRPANYCSSVSLLPIGENRSEPISQCTTAASGARMPQSVQTRREPPPDRCAVRIWFYGGRVCPSGPSGQERTGPSALLMDHDIPSVGKQLDRSRRPVACAACIFDARGKARKLRYGLWRQAVYTPGAASVVAGLQVQVHVTCLAQCGRPCMTNRTKRTARTPMTMPISRNTVRANSNTAFCNVLDRPAVMLTDLGIRA
jgi:hypothetical protein